MHIALVTAGGAGMFCGSCMLDNAWARGLMQAGVEVSLLPMYTPLRLDEASAANARVFVGGVNMYLSHKYAWWSRLPRWMTRWLDSQRVLQAASQGGVSNNARELGELTVTTLQAEQGPFRPALEELVDYVVALRPDVVLYSNSMLLGSLRLLKQAISVPVLCLLQGDDVFLNSLVDPFRSTVMTLLVDRAREFDGFIVHSDYYQRHMGQYLQIPNEKFHRLPLAIDCTPHVGRPKWQLMDPATIGYLARLAPEKGLRELVQAVQKLSARYPHVQLHAAGYAQGQYASYRTEVEALAAPLGDRFRYVGSPSTVAEKSAFLSSCDVFSVPTNHGEPKGLPILEAWANGVPVVQPRDGGMPELVDSTRGGWLVPPGDTGALADALEQALRNETERNEVAQRGWEQVRRKHDLPVLTEASLALFRELL